MDKNIYSLIEEQALNNPKKTAIKTLSQINITYGQLIERVNQIAIALAEEGIKEHDVIALMLEQCPEMIESILAIHKIGAVYIPIDPNLSDDVIVSIVEKSKPRIIISKKIYFINVSTKVDLTLIDIEYLYSKTTNIENYTFISYLINKQEDLAYIMPTSGSTGSPKLVMIKNKSLWNYINWAAKYYCDDLDCVRFPFFTSVSFDLTITSIYLPLLKQGVIYCFPNCSIKEVIVSKDINVIKLTPSQLSIVKDYDNSLTNLKKIIVGGECLLQETAYRMWMSTGGKVEIFNEYGPTEITVGSMVKKFNIEDKHSSILIGKPIDNTTIHLLDEAMNDVGINQYGEIYISGDGVSKGYMHMKKKTMENFIVKNNVMMYKTGDMARRLKNGEFEYIGRIQTPECRFEKDGHIICMADIENTLLSHKSVFEAVAVIKAKKTYKYIELFYVAVEFSEEEVKRYLEKKLDLFMIPYKITKIDIMPLNFNKKISRPALRGVSY